MTNDPLAELAKKANAVASDQSPYQVKKEGSRPIQIRDSTYKEIKKLSFEKDVKMVDLVNNMLRYALNNGDFK